MSRFRLKFKVTSRRRSIKLRQSIKKQRSTNRTKWHGRRQTFLQSRAWLTPFRINYSLCLQSVAVSVEIIQSIRFWPPVIETEKTREHKRYGRSYNFKTACIFLVILDVCVTYNWPFVVSDTLCSYNGNALLLRTPEDSVKILWYGIAYVT